MTAEFQIREYRKDDEEKVINLYKDTFGETGALRFAHRWKWEFLDNPAKKIVACNNWVIELKGKIIGHLGSLPALLKINKQVLPCLWAVDLMIDNNYRRQGLAKKLYQKFESAPSSANFMIGLSVPTVKIAKARAWQECNADIVALRIINFRGIKSFLFSRKIFHFSYSWIMLVLGIAFGKVLSCLKVNITKEYPDDINIFSISNFDERFDQFWQEISQQYPIIFLRNKVFSNWRFIKNPNFHYKILAAEKNNKFLGFIVTDIKVINGCRVGCIIDFLTNLEYPLAASSLLKEAVQYLKTQDVGLIISTGLSCHQRSAMKEQGFFVNPFINKHLKPRFFFKVHKDDPTIDFLIKPNNWYLSNSDYDVFM